MSRVQNDVDQLQMMVSQNIVMVGVNMVTLIGIIIIMFALGFEENSSKFVQGIKRSWGIALFGAIAPFLVATAWQCISGMMSSSRSCAAWQ